MQESYISLDPERADSMTSQQRERVWSQRVQETCGGEAGSALGTQAAWTTMLCTYTMMRSRGFRMTPFAATKIPAIGGVLLAGLLGYGFGSSYASASIGDSVQYYHLLKNKSSIMAGTTPFDAPKD